CLAQGAAGPACATASRRAPPRAPTVDLGTHTSSPRPGRTPNPSLKRAPALSECRGVSSCRSGGCARLQVGDEADVDGLVDEVVLATGQVLHVPVVVLLVGGRDRLVLVRLESVGPDAERLDVVVTQRQRLGHDEAGFL